MELMIDSPEDAELEEPRRILEWPEVPLSSFEGNHIDIVQRSSSSIIGRAGTKSQEPIVAPSVRPILKSSEDAEIATSSTAAKTAQQSESPRRRWLRQLDRFTIPRRHWPDPHLSIGTKCNRMGPNECWEAIGPAKLLFNEIAESIGKLLDDRMDELEDGEPIAVILTFGMYMIGKSPVTALPTLVFTCQRSKPRRRAIKYIKESAILNGRPKIALAESSVVPIATTNNYLRLLAGNSGLGNTGKDSGDMKLPRDPGESTLPLGPVGTSLLDIYGVPIICASTGRRATIGGIVRIHGAYYGLTVAHLFENSCDNFQSAQKVPESKYEDGDPEFAFDDDEDETDHEYTDDDQIEDLDVIITTQGSVSSAAPILSRSETTTSMSSRRYSDSQSVYTEAPAAEIVLLNTEQNSLSDSDFRPAIRLGELLISSTSESQLGLDWSLVRLSEYGLREAQNASLKRELLQNVVYPRQLVTSLEQDAAIVVIKGYSGISRGSISSSITMMRLPHDNRFQEVWMVRLDSSLVEGDSGSWVIDAVSGDLYGHIVVGLLDGCAAYIVPAYKIFADLQRTLGVAELVSSSEATEQLRNGNRHESLVNENLPAQNCLPLVQHPASLRDIITDVSKRARRRLGSLNVSDVHEVSSSRPSYSHHAIDEIEPIGIEMHENIRWNDSNYQERHNMAYSTSSTLFPFSDQLGVSDQLAMETHSFLHDSVNKIDTFYTSDDFRPYKDNTGRQLRHLLIDGSSRWLTTVALCIGYISATMIWQQKRAQNSGEQKMYNAITTVISIALGLNISSAFKDMALGIRWVILSQRKWNLVEMDLLLHADPIGRLAKLVFITRRPLVIVGVLLWLLINIIAQAGIAMLSRTHSFDVDTVAVQYNFGNVSIPDMTRFQPQRNFENPNPSWQDESYIAHTYGELTYHWGINTSNYKPKAGEIYQANTAMVWLDDSEGIAEFIFSDSPIDEELGSSSVYTARTINATYTCESHKVTMGGNGTTLDITVEDLGNLTVYKTFPGSTTYFVAKDSHCVDNVRCQVVQAFEASNTDPWYYKCNITLGRTTYDPQNVSFISDYMAQIATSSIAQTGFVDKNGETGETYSQDSPWGISLNGNADKMGMSMAAFTLGSIAGASMYNPYTSYPGAAPSQGVYLHLGHPYFFNLTIGLICGCHLFFLISVAVVANRVEVGPEGTLSIALMLRSIANALDGVSGGKENRALRDAKRHTLVRYEKRSTGKWALNMC